MVGMMPVSFLPDNILKHIYMYPYIFSHKRTN